jgi:hypothetical protein
MATDESPVARSSLRPGVSISTAIDLGAASVVFAVLRHLDDHTVWRFLSSRGCRSPPVSHLPGPCR